MCDRQQAVSAYRAEHRRESVRLFFHPTRLEYISVTFGKYLQEEPKAFCLQP